jgi:hypothetical protein
MRQTQRSFAAFSMLVVASAASTAAVADGQGACGQIRAACEAAGFIRGAANLGIGLQVDCVIPIIWGTPQRPRARKVLPQVDPQLIAACATGHARFARPNALTAEPDLRPSGAGRLLPGRSDPNDNPPRVYGADAQVAPGAPIPLPEPGLLERQPAPDCEFKADAPADGEVAVRAMKLDYEQQCYRQSEFILRARMERLQDAVRNTIESLKRQERTSPQ